MADEIFYSGRGDGETVLCLHDLWSSSKSFDEVEITSSLFRLCAWDAPGYGRSNTPVANADLRWYADQAGQMVHQLGPAPAHIVGSGWGALVAMQLAVSHPDSVKSLVLSGANVGLQNAPNSAAKLREGAKQFSDNPDEFIANLAPTLVSADGNGVSSVKDVLKHDVNANGVAVATETMVTSDVTSKLKSLRIPTLVMWGDHDQVWNLETSIAVAEPIADSVVVTCAGAGHLIHVDRPEAYSVWLDSFLRIVDNVREHS